MKTVASAATVAALVGAAAAQSSPPTVTTPTSLVECQPAQFSVSGGTAPYFLTILPGGESGATPLENLPTQNAAGSVTWNVDLASGQAITIAVRDSTGALNYSQQVTIQAGTSSACLGQNSGGGGAASGSASGGASSTAAGSSAAASSSAAPASTSSRAASSSSAAASSSAPASSSSSSSSRAASSSSSPATSAATSASSPSATSNSGAGELIAQTGFLGAVAAFVMAVIA